ncbi:hypothetical protein NMY22_g9480 [Coprinellus aureogranulatus]|nr:hypothetical protein NMY22_g9480 [Coprinellus aureogranulatus]
MPLRSPTIPLPPTRDIYPSWQARSHRPRPFVATPPTPPILYCSPFTSPMSSSFPPSLSSPPSPIASRTILHVPRKVSLAFPRRLTSPVLRLSESSGILKTLVWNFCSTILRKEARWWWLYTAPLSPLVVVWIGWGLRGMAST